MPIKFAAASFDTDKVGVANELNAFRIQYIELTSPACILRAIVQRRRDRGLGLTANFFLPLHGRHPKAASVNADYAKVFIHHRCHVDEEN